MYALPVVHPLYNPRKTDDETRHRIGDEWNITRLVYTDRVIKNSRYLIGRCDCSKKMTSNDFSSWAKENIVVTYAEFVPQWVAQFMHNGHQMGRYKCIIVLHYRRTSQAFIGRKFSRRLHQNIL